MLVWIFLAVALAAVAATVVYAGLAVRAAKNSADRGRYRRAAIVSALLTVVTVVAGGVLTRRARDNGDGAYLANDLAEDMGEDTFLETIAATS